MKKFDYEIAKNPEIFQENRLPAHSDHVCFPNWFKSEYNSYRMSLDGLWKFDYAKNMSLAVDGFEAEDYCCEGWDEIRVPSHIQMEGYDVPHYTNTTIDLYAISEKYKTLQSDDGVHFTEEGYMAFAQYIVKQIEGEVLP